MKNKILYIPILFVIIISFYGCPENNSCHIDYKFQIPVSFSPAKDTFHIGDTIWIESNIYKNMFDKNSGDSIFVGDNDFKIIGAIDRFLENGDSPNAENDFDYVNDIGEFRVINLSNTSKIYLYYDYINDFQKLKVGIIPRILGIHKIAFYNKRKDLIINLLDDCDESLTINFNMNQGEDNNFHLVKWFYDEFYPDSDYSIDGFTHDGGYAFVVVE